MAAVTAHSQKTVLETPALEVIIEFLLHIPRQVRAVRRQLRLEHWAVFLDELIKRVDKVEFAPGVDLSAP